jgi:hypothetical protein
MYSFFSIRNVRRKMAKLNSYSSKVQTLERHESQCIIVNIRSRGTRCGTGVGCENADTHQQRGLANTKINLLVTQVV